MKRIITSTLFVLALVLTSFQVSQAQNNGNGGNDDNMLIGRAIGAFQSQCDVTGIGQIGGNVSTTGICFVQGFTKRVILYPIIQCHQFPCPLVLVRPLGSVDFDCDNNVVSVNCGFTF